MQNNAPVDNSDEFKQKSVTVNDPSGTVFFELSTATSKNYENNKPGSHAHIANSFAVNGVQSFSVVNITNGSLSIDTYRTDTMEVYDSYTINKADRTKLDKSIEEANAIIASGKYTDEQLVELNAALQAALSVPQDCDLITAYDAAVVLDEAIKAFDPILYGDANGDGDIMINDCIFILKYGIGACEMTPAQLVLLSFESLGKYVDNIENLWFDIDKNKMARNKIKTNLALIARYFVVKEQYYEVAVNSLLYEIYHILLADCLVEKEKLPYDANNNFHYAKSAIEYIGTHYTDDISLSEVSSYVGLSPSYFLRYFKIITKNTFVHYLNGSGLKTLCVI